MAGRRGPGSREILDIVREQREPIVDGHSRNDHVAEVKSGAFTSIVALELASQTGNTIEDVEPSRVPATG